MHDSRREMGTSGAKRFIERVAQLFSDSGLTPAELDVLAEGVTKYEEESAMAVLAEYRRNCRYKRPVFPDLLKALDVAKYGTVTQKGLNQTEAIVRGDEVTNAQIAAERRVAETIHIPALIRLGRDEVKRRRDALLRGMNQASRNMAGAPTWEQLTGMGGDSPRLRCWRFWIITEQADTYEPEVENA